MNAICLVIDRLHCGYLGSYGNSWVGTPTFDRLASEGFLFDQAFVDSPRLEELYRSYWQGRHALEAESAHRLPGLAELVAGRGVTATLITDQPAVASHRLSRGFGNQVLELDPPREAGLAGAVEETHLAQCFARIIEWLPSARQPFLLWCHLQGLAAPWDAPEDFRTAYVDEDDPPLVETAEVPRRLLPADYDPDELLGITQAYSGQVSLLDTCLGALVEFLDEDPLGSETLLAVSSPRGFPLGEHRRVGSLDDALHAELTHVPMILRLPEGVGAMARSAAMVEPADLWATLLDWCGVADRPAARTARSLLPFLRAEEEEVRDRLAIRGRDQERAILTPAWYLRMGERPELYARPDDRRQVNDVADRLPEVTELLRETAARFEQAIQSGQSPYSSLLEEILVSGVD